MAPPVVRENRWVRVYQFPSGDFADSKFRLHECDAGPDDVIRAWQAASEEEKADIETALRFCEHPGRSRITDHIAYSDAKRAARIGANFVGPRSPISDAE